MTDLILKPPPLLTVEAVIAILGLSRQAVYRSLRSGAIPHVKVGTMMVATTTIEAMIGRALTSEEVVIALQATFNKRKNKSNLRKGMKGVKIPHPSEPGQTT